MKKAVLRVIRIPALQPSRHFLSALGFLCVAIWIILNVGAFAANTQDDKGLVPPASADRSPRMAHVRAFLASADLPDAQREIEGMIESEPGSYEGYFWKGIVQSQRGEDYDAIRSLRHAEALDPNPSVLKVLAFSYYKVRQFRLFILKMNEAMAKQPEDYSPYYCLGRYYENEVNDYDKAARYYEQAAIRNPKHFQSYYHLGHCLEVQGKVTEAEQQYQISARLSEAQGATFAAPYQGMARLRIVANKPDQALTFAVRAVDLAPNDAASHKVLAQIYSILGRQSDAIDEWKQTAQLDPTDSSPYYHLFRIYRAMGNKELASSALTQFEELSSLY